MFTEYFTLTQEFNKSKFNNNNNNKNIINKQSEVF